MRIFMLIVIVFAVQPVKNSSFRSEGRRKHVVEDERNAKSEVTRIYYGERAQSGEFPYVVALMNMKEDKWEEYCVGTLYVPSRVLTACHCIEQRKPKDIKLMAGSVMLSEKEFEDKHAQVRYGIRLNKHPKCSLESNDVRYDFGVVVLDESFVFERLFVEYLTIPKYDDTKFIEQLTRKGIICQVMGWGITDKEKSPSWLMKMELRLHPSEWCAHRVKEVSQNQAVGPDKYNKNWHLCGVGILKNQTTCGGDSGAPLICKDNQKTVIAGIMSFGPGSDPCGKHDMPNVFARIENFGNTKGFAFDRAPTGVPYTISIVVVVAYLVVVPLMVFITNKLLSTTK